MRHPPRFLPLLRPLRHFLDAESHHSLPQENALQQSPHPDDPLHRRLRHRGHGVQPADKLLD